MSALIRESEVVSTPIRRLPLCAPAAQGHGAVAPANAAMKSRRRIASLKAKELGDVH